ncbi:hypothetical protein IW136_001100 [Coemansia sp. RSA 678]|nr:hypothetical protein IW136_001100 [Coemansia sp. RSA 678]
MFTMKKQLSLLSALVVGTVVRAQAPEPRQTGMGLYEVDVDYDSAEIFSTKQDNRFDQAEAFTRDIVSFVAAQGYTQPASDPFKPEFSPNPANNRDQAAAYDIPAQNEMFATMAPETIPLPQLLDKVQSVMQLNQNANPGCQAPPTSNPVCVAPTMTTCCPPLSPTRWSCPKPSKPFKPSTHTVYVSVETNRATKPSLCQETCGCGSYSDSDSDSDCEEPKKTKKHHKHKHYRHNKGKKEKERWEPEVEELDENECFGRAVLSISSDDGENVATIGQNLYQCETKCETKWEPKSQPKWASKWVSKWEPKVTHTVYESIESNCKSKSEYNYKPTCEPKCEPKRESKCEPKWEPKVTHTVYESVESNCKPKSEYNYKPTCEPKNTHTVYESVESKCEPKCESKY